MGGTGLEPVTPKLVELALNGETRRPYLPIHLPEAPRLIAEGPDSARAKEAGGGNRTRMTSLEGWGSTIELRPRDRLEQ